MSSLEHRLEKLEVGAGKGAASGWEVPIATRLYLTMVACHRARIEGEEPLPYTQEEVEERRRQDLETASGKGAEAMLRCSIGWQTPEARRCSTSGSRRPRGEWKRQRTYPPSAGQRFGEWTKKSRSLVGS